jgi:hypothetical protein
MQYAIPETESGRKLRIDSGLGSRGRPSSFSRTSTATITIDGGHEVDFETIWYEYTPYLYAIAGIMFILHIGSVIGICFGLLLVAAAGVIIFRRHNYRKSQSSRKQHRITSFR